MTALDGLSLPWPVMPLRRALARIEQGWSPVAEDRRADDGEWGVIKLSAVGVGHFDASEHKALAADTVPESRFEIRRGDLLVTRANTPELVGEACVVQGTRPRLMLCDLVYRLWVDERTVHKPFLAYWLASRPGRAQVEADARGSSQSMVKVSQAHIRSWLVPTPPLHEQRTVADFLDRKTAGIDALIAKKEQFAELLEERRRGLIMEKITGGQGIAMLRRAVPRTWTLKRLKHLLAAPLAYGILKPDKYTGKNAVPVVRILDVDNGVVDVDRLERVSPSMNEEYRRTILREGDLVVSVVGTIGRSFIVPCWLRGANLSRALARVQLRVPELAMFVDFWVASNVFDAQAGAVAQGSAQKVLNLSDLGEFLIGVPPHAEAIALAAELRRAVAAVDKQQRAVRDSIKLLAQYRQAVITAAVTGSIDVDARPQEAA